MRLVLMTDPKLTLLNNLYLLTNFISDGLISTFVSGEMTKSRNTGMNPPDQFSGTW